MAAAIDVVAQLPQLEAACERLYVSQVGCSLARVMPRLTPALQALGVGGVLLLPCTPLREVRGGAAGGSPAAALAGRLQRP